MNPKDLRIVFLVFMMVLGLQGFLQAQIFTNVSDSVNLPIPAGIGYFGVWLDYNEDGWPDILASADSTHLYRNNGGINFTEVTNDVGLGGVYISNISIGDFDNDGWQDILSGSKIFRNNQGQNFYLYKSLGVSINRSIWIDYDGDSYLDVFGLKNGTGFLLFKNTGDTTFQNISSLMSFPSFVGATCAAADYNNDGFTDIYIGRYSGNNALIKNIAGANFENQSPANGFADSRNTVSVAWGDYNNDGYLDIYSANIQSSRNSLFRNNRNETFTDVTTTAGVPDVGDARTASFIDYNNDGWLDIFTANHVNPNRLYKNNRNGSFTDVAVQSGITDPQDGFGVSWADFDHDGDLDVFIIHHMQRHMHLLKNNGGNEKNWLFVKLIGTYDNRMGIGTRMDLHIDTLRLSREVNAGTGNVGQEGFPSHFGLGDAAIVDSLIIRWSSGMVQKLTNISANQTIEVLQSGNVPPAVFHLISPANNDTISDSLVTFKWTNSVDPDSGLNLIYKLHIQNNQGLDTVFIIAQDTSYSVLLNPFINSPSIVSWYVEACDGDVSRMSWEKYSFQFNPLTLVEDANTESPREFKLLNNFPNPFNPTTTIKFEVPYSSRVVIDIYNCLGEHVRKLLDNNFDRGQYTVNWDGMSEQGKYVAAGVYYLSMNASTIGNGNNDQFQRAIKLVVQK